MAMDATWRPYIAELIGTFLLVFLSAGAVCADAVAANRGAPAITTIVPPRPGVAVIALAAGFALAAGLAATSAEPRGFLNPAITLMFWVFKRLEGGQAAALIGVQFLGAVIAGGLVRLLFSFNELAITAARVGTPHVDFAAFDPDGLTSRALFSGIAVEVVFTFILTFVIFATMIDPRPQRYLGRGRLSGLWAGLVLVAITVVGQRYTGAAVNPARWFGTVIWESTVPTLATQQPFADHVVYWVGPIMGALIAGGIYSMVIMPEEPDPERPLAAAGKATAGTPSRAHK
jgi:glycerol uptake facilitator-like aquaporin